jgi:predicted  nucleic acid-binding Zn-ribbon protein
MAKQIEAEARQTQTTLREETRAIESRLESLARGVQETGSQLDALLQRSKSSESLLDAISVDRQRASTREKDS